MSNPVLVELTRGNVVESIHRGAIAIMDAGGKTILTLGDIDRPIYPRSAFKAIQALPLIESGAANAIAMSNAEIALACASHSGDPVHVDCARQLLSRLGLDENALACGAHMPSGEQAARELVSSGASPGRLHNNCSGKHAGMLALARHLDAPIDGYEKPDHPVQQCIRAAIEEMTGVTLTSEVRGIDGCSAPNWAMPLRGLARAFARFSVQEDMNPSRSAACRRILGACFAEPHMVAGSGRLCSLIMERLKGQAFVKTGAEGVYAALFPNLGLGAAIKIDDGAKRAAEMVVAAVCVSLLPQAARALEGFPDGILRDWNTKMVGEIRLSGETVGALASLNGHLPGTGY